MERVRYITDDGGITVGNDDLQIIIPNGYGDGAFWLYVYINEDEWREGPGARMRGRVPEWTFSTSFVCRDGEAGPTCAQGYGELPAGRWAAYRNDGDVALVAWDLLGDGVR